MSGRSYYLALFNLDMCVFCGASVGLNLVPAAHSALITDELLLLIGLQMSDSSLPVYEFQKIYGDYGRTLHLDPIADEELLPRGFRFQNFPLGLRTNPPLLQVCRCPASSALPF